MLSSSLRRATATSIPSPISSSFSPDFTFLISRLPVSLRHKTLISLPYLVKTSPSSLQSLDSLHSLLLPFSVDCPLQSLFSSCTAAFCLSRASLSLRPLAQSLLSTLLLRTNPSTSSSSILFQWADHYCSLDMEIRYYALDFVLRAFLVSGMASEALAVVCRIRSIHRTPSLTALSILLRLLYQKGDMGNAWKVFVEMLTRGPLPSCQTFNIVILGFCRRGFLRVGEGLLRVMRKFQLEPDSCSYNILIKAHCAYGRLDDAFEMFVVMLEGGSFPTVVTYNILVDKLCREGRMVEARKLFDSMAEVGIKHNTITYNVLLDGYVKAGQVEKANLAYMEMKRNGLVPDLCTLNILLSGQYKFRKVLVGEKENILDELTTPDVDLLISRFCWEGQLDKAREVLLQAIKDGVPVGVTGFNSLLYSYSKEGLEEETFMLYRTMLDVGLSPSASTCNALIMAACNARMLKDARDLLDDMLKRGFCVNTSAFTIYLDACFKAGDSTSAMSCWQDMKQYGLNPDLVAFSAYINGLCKANCMQEAAVAFNDMVHSGLVPNNFTYNSLIHGLCKTGDVDQALQLEERMRQQGLVPDIYTTNILIDGFCRCGMVKTANKLLSQMYSSGPTPDVVTYNTFINMYCGTHDMTNAIGYLNKMLSQGCLPDLYTYNIWIHSLCMDHMMNRAMKLLDELESMGFLPNSVTYTILVNGLCRDVLDRAVIVTARLLKMAFVPNSITVNVLLSQFCKLGMYNRALTWARKLSEAELGFDDVTWKVIDWAQREVRDGNDRSREDSARSHFIEFLMIITYNSLFRQNQLGVGI
ncbi:uncharacterized protein LOC144551705 [Carex rostrata]